jgi:hypothetical protein
VDCSALPLATGDSGPERLELSELVVWELGPDSANCERNAGTGPAAIAGLLLAGDGEPYAAGVGIAAARPYMVAWWHGRRLVSRRV